MKINHTFNYLDDNKIRGTLSIFINGLPQTAVMDTQTYEKEVKKILYAEKLNLEALQKYFLDPLLKEKNEEIIKTNNMLNWFASQKLFSVEDGEVKYKGVLNPLPKPLLERLFESDNTTLMAFRQFWVYMSAYGDKQVREDLVNWIIFNKFQITENGLIVGYKGVNNTQISEYEKALVRISDGLEPKDMAKIDIYKEKDGWVGREKSTGFKSMLAAMTTFAKSFNVQKNKVGNLLTLFNNIHRDRVYTDWFKGVTTIKVKHYTSQSWRECDYDRNNVCSRGLHFTNLKGLKHWYFTESARVVVLINPLDMVAFPYDNASKARCQRYYTLEVGQEFNHNFEGVLMLDEEVKDYLDNTAYDLVKKNIETGFPTQEEYVELINKCHYDTVKVMSFDIEEFHYEPTVREFQVITLPENVLNLRDDVWSKEEKISCGWVDDGGDGDYDEDGDYDYGYDYDYDDYLDDSECTGDCCEEGNCKYD